MKLTGIFIALMIGAASVNSQSLNLRFSTYFYGWERGDSLLGDSKTSHLRGYQSLLLEASNNKWSFNSLMQIDEDLINKIDKGFDFRFYNLYVKGTDLFNVLDLKLGRQYVFAGVGKSAMDGLNFKIKAGKNKEYQFGGFGGGLTPYNYDFRNYPALEDNYIFGGIFSYYGVRSLTAALSYVNKHRKPESYTAMRLDSLLNTKEVLIDFDSKADQLVGLDLNYSYLQKHFFYGKAYYDLNNKKFYRGEFNASLTVANNLRLTAMYEYREPQISYNTIFWTFAHKQYQEIGGSINYTLKNGINIFGSISDVIYTDDNSLKIQLGINNPSFSLSYVKYTGYAGESDGAYGYYSRELLKSILSGNLSLNYSRYNIGDYSTEKEKAFSGMLGFTYRPSTYFSFDVQGQLISNRIYKYDTRFLVGVSYWLFKKY